MKDKIDPFEEQAKAVAEQLFPLDGQRRRAIFAQLMQYDSTLYDEVKRYLSRWSSSAQSE